MAALLESGDVDRAAEAFDVQELCLSEAEYNAVRVFSRMQTQWNRSSFSGALEGLRYECLPVITSTLKIELTDELLSDIQFMEAEIITETAKRAKARQPSRRG